jgi:hypothetical protein
MRLPLPFPRKPSREKSDSAKSGTTPQEHSGKTVRDSTDVMYKRLEAIDPSLKDSVSILPDFTREEIYGGYTCYYLIPRLKAQPSIDALGHSFSLFYERCDPSDKYRARVYAIIRGHPEKLRQSFELVEADPDWRKYNYVVHFHSGAEKNAANYEYFIDRGIAAVFSLPPNTGLLFSAAQDPKLYSFLVKKLNSLKKKNPAASAKLLEAKLAGIPVLVSISAFAEDKERAKMCADIIRKYIPAPAKKSIRKMKDPKKEFYRLLLPPKMPRMRRNVLTASYSTLMKIPLLPTADLEGVEYTRFAKMPAVEEICRGGIVLGKVENREFSLDPSDLYRHAYIIGGTGSGKTNLLKILIKNLHDLGYPVFVIDPHGELSAEMACVLGNSVFLHPYDSPFGFNPLELPTMKDRNQQVLMSVDELMNLFTNVFHLPETAMNVRYILQTVARQIYKRGGIPTLAGLYKIVMAIYSGHDIGISDQQFREEEKALRNMPDQSFISTLSRLQSFAADKTLLSMTSTTTIDIDRFMDERKTVLFSLPQRHIGLTASTLLASTLLLKIYYTKLLRYDSKKDEHVFVVIDEFQTLQSLPILATILSEARKFGLHLILAHQYLDQLTPDVRQAAIANAGIKFIFSASGKDADELALIDPSFEREIKSVITNLSVGYCVVKLSSRKGDESLPPMVLRVDEFKAQPVRTLEQARTDEFRPGEVEFSFELVNPIFKFIDPPFSAPQRIVQAVMKFGSEATINDIAGATGYKTDFVSKLVSEMVSKKYLEKETVRDRTVVRIADGFYEQFYSVSPSEEGRKLVEQAVRHYMRQDYYVTPTKNTKIPRPDLICIPYDGYYLDYSRAIEVEIEVTTPTHDSQTHQLMINTMTKNTPFKERHVWCRVEDFPIVLEYARMYANKKTVVIAPDKDGLRMEVVEPVKSGVGEEVENVFGKKKDVNIPDAGVEESFVEALDRERREEESAEQKATLSAPAKTAQNAPSASPPATVTKASELGIPAALLVRIRLALGPDLYKSIESEGLLKELADIVATKNLPSKEIPGVALDLLRRKESESRTAVQLQEPSKKAEVRQESVIDTLARLNPNLSRDDVEKLYNDHLEILKKTLSLGLSAEETKQILSEFYTNMNDTLSLLGADVETETVQKSSEETVDSVSRTPTSMLTSTTATGGTPPAQKADSLSVPQMTDAVPNEGGRLETPEGTLPVRGEKESVSPMSEERKEPSKKDGKLSKMFKVNKAFMKTVLGMEKDSSVIEVEGRRVRVLRGSPAELRKLLESGVAYKLFSRARGTCFERISDATPGNYIITIGGYSIDVHIE